MSTDLGCRRTWVREGAVRLALSARRCTVEVLLRWRSGRVGRALSV